MAPSWQGQDGGNLMGNFVEKKVKLAFVVVESGSPLCYTTVL